MLGLVGTSIFAAIAWWIAVNGPGVWLGAALIAAAAALLSLWAQRRIWADLQRNRVIAVTGRPRITFEDHYSRMLVNLAPTAPAD